MLGDLNARGGNEVIEGTVGQHGVPGRNECKYTWVRTVELRVVDRALMD